MEKYKNEKCKKYELTGKTIAALIDPMLTLLVKTTSTSPITTHNKDILQSIANTAPIVGATPFPALNL